MKESQNLKQQEIVTIQEQILDLKEQLEKAKAENEPQIRKNQEAAEAQDQFLKEFSKRI